MTAVTGTAVRPRARGAGPRLRLGDLLLLGSAGLRAKPARAFLAALGIAIGVAAMVSVLGISTSSQARLNETLDQLGTNLLTATVTATPSSDSVPLPVNAAKRVNRLDEIDSASFSAELTTTHVYRNSMIDADRTGGLTVTAVDLDLLPLVAGSVRQGQWLNQATASFPTTVLGSVAAQRLAVTEPGALVWLGGRTVKVVGILDPLPLAPELDYAAMIGIPVAEKEYGFTGNPTRIYQRVDEQAIDVARTRIASAINPETPAAIAVSRPSDALAAINAIDSTFTALLVGLGSVALVVGAVGIANTMVVSVIERRGEIGLRRALGATRAHIRAQFLVEALVLSLIGGVIGMGVGWCVTAGVCLTNGWPVVVPPFIFVVGIGSTLLVGVVAGLYPAIRASRVSPTSALHA